MQRGVQRWTPFCFSGRYDAHEGHDLSGSRLAGGSLLLIAQASDAPAPSFSLTAAYVPALPTPSSEPANLTDEFVKLRKEVQSEHWDIIFLDENHSRFVKVRSFDRDRHLGTLFLLVPASQTSTQRQVETRTRAEVLKSYAPLPRRFGW